MPTMYICDDTNVRFVRIEGATFIKASDISDSVAGIHSIGVGQFRVCAPYLPVADAPTKLLDNDDTKRIDPMLNELCTIWKAYPHLRLAQLVCMVAGGIDPLDVKDDDLMRRMRDYSGRK